jgi:mannose-6-phosphate isomerase-like protein (cupin superfamily)
MAKAHDLRAALRGRPAVTAETTEEQFAAACAELGTFDRGHITLVRLATPSPWENHPDGDELLYIAKGTIEVELLARRRERVRVSAGSIFVVPRGVWHRQIPCPLASVLSALPSAHGPISWDDDPRLSGDR